MSLRRVIRLLCIVLVVLTCSLVYVIQHALVTDTVVIKQQRSLFLRKQQQQQRGLGGYEAAAEDVLGQNNKGNKKLLATVSGSSLETMFRKLRIDHCGLAKKRQKKEAVYFAENAIKGHEDDVGKQKKDSGLWKPLKTKGKADGEVLLTAAYLDDRTVFANVTYKFVRILGVKKGRDARPDLYCHYYLKRLVERGRQTSSRPLISLKATYNEIWVSAWHPRPPEHYYHSIMIHCPIPMSSTLASSAASEVAWVDLDDEVIVSAENCDPGNGTSLPVRRGGAARVPKRSKKESKSQTVASARSTGKEDFCVCVKPLDFPDQEKLASRLIDWIEVNRLLGAAKIVIYIYSGTFRFETP